MMTVNEAIKYLENFRDYLIEQSKQAKSKEEFTKNLEFIQALDLVLTAVNFQRKIPAPDLYELGSAIASTIDAFIAQEGIHSLLKPETAVLLNENYSIGLTQSPETVRERSKIKALVYLRDLADFEQFKNIQTDSDLRESFGYAATDQLASHVLAKMLEQIPQ